MSEKEVSRTPENRRKTGDRKLRGGHSPDVGKATQFKPGETGNPGGRPKQLLTDAYLRQLLKQAEGDETQADAIAKAIVKRALTGKGGDVRAAAEIADRVQGKPPQAHTGEDGGPIVHVIRYPRDPMPHPVKD